MHGSRNLRCRVMDKDFPKLGWLIGWFSGTWSSKASVWINRFLAETTIGRKESKFSWAGSGEVYFCLRRNLRKPPPPTRNIGVLKQSQGPEVKGPLSLTCLSVILGLLQQVNRCAGVDACNAKGWGVDLVPLPTLDPHWLPASNHRTVLKYCILEYHTLTAEKNKFKIKNAQQHKIWFP